MRSIIVVIISLVVTHASSTNSNSYTVTSGIPLTILMDSNMDSNARFIIEKAIKYVNTDLKSSRIQWNFHIKQIAHDMNDLLTNSEKN